MIEYLRSLYPRIRAAWPPNRVVALVTPLTATVAGYVATWVAANFPGLPALDEAWLGGIFIAGAASAAAAAYKWLDGWAKYEESIARYNLERGQPPAGAKREENSPGKDQRS